MVNVQCRDIGVKFVSMWGGWSKVSTLWHHEQPALASQSYTELVPIECEVSSCCTGLVLFVSLLTLEELFGPDRFAGGKILVWLMTYATSQHQILLLLGQCRSSKKRRAVEARANTGRWVFQPERGEPTAFLSREADGKVDMLLSAGARKAGDPDGCCTYSDRA